VADRHPRSVTAALTALTHAGRVAGASKPEPMYGTDAGRVRRYVRLSVPMATPSRTTPTQPRGGQAVIDVPEWRAADPTTVE
jgi:hypothetical protein